MGKSKRQTGLEFQNWIKKWLEERGWIVHNQTPVGKMIFIKGKKIFVSQRNDIFGCDLIARKEKRLLWIQGSLDSHIQKRIEAFEQYFKGLLGNEDLMIWIKTDKGINIKSLYYIYNFEISESLRDIDIGKIIRRKFYSSEGVSFEF